MRSLFKALLDSFVTGLQDVEMSRLYLNIGAAELGYDSKTFLTK